MGLGYLGLISWFLRLSMSVIATFKGYLVQEAHPDLSGSYHL